MTVSEQAEQKPIDQIFLANNHMTNLLAQCRNPLAQLSHFLGNFLRRFHSCDVRQTRNKNLRSNCCPTNTRPRISSAAFADGGGTSAGAEARGKVALCGCELRGNDGKFRSISEARSQKGRTPEVRVQFSDYHSLAQRRRVSSVDRRPSAAD